jgi:hypothetical protein
MSSHDQQVSDRATADPAAHPTIGVPETRSGAHPNSPSAGYGLHRSTTHPPLARVGAKWSCLPSQEKGDVWRLIGQMQWIFVLALAAGLAALVIPLAAWLGAVLVPLELLLVHALGISGRYWSRAERGGSSPAAEHMTFISRYDVSSGRGTNTPRTPASRQPTGEAVRYDCPDPPRTPR